MATPQVQTDPIINLPLLYIYGMKVTNDATTPNTQLDISTGQCRDSNNVMDICFGTSGTNQTIQTTPPIIINALVNGANGLDTGALAASTVYAVYAIGDSRNYMAPAAILTLASNAAPLMPFGYDSNRLIYFVVTNSSSYFLKFYNSGDGNTRLFTYDAPIVALSAGAATTYTGVALTAFVPPVNNLQVWIYSNFAANAAGNTLNFQGYNSTGDAVTIIAPVATGTANTTTTSRVLAQLNTAAPSIKYKVAAGSVTAYVTAFEMFV